MQRGFSLVELSIVLVILGLLVGTIMSGQSLIHAAELRSVTAEYSKLVAATKSFRDRYFALPGDMPNATLVWGAVAAPGSCRNTVSTDAKTCDGDGDGRIAPSAASWEQNRFFQHLANGGLIEGSYGGVGTVKSDYMQSRLSSDAVWSEENSVNYAPNSSLFKFGGEYGNVLQLAGWSTGAVLSPTDAWSLDTKMDDGLPGTGSVVSQKGIVSRPCTSAQGTVLDAGAVYNYSLDGAFCILYFRKAL